jgi:FkbM family methyltransferase
VKTETVIDGHDNLQSEQKAGEFYSRISDIIRLKPRDIAIDCGANVGDVTVQMALPGVEVHAFEPNPYAFSLLQNRFKDNPNVHCYQKGVYIKNDVMQLYMHKNASQDQILWSTGSSLLSFKGNINVNDYVKVNVIDFAEFLRSMRRRVRLVKMDVEGVECDILNHLIDCGLVSVIDVIVAEMHDRKVLELAEKTKKLKQRVKELGIKNIRFDWT